MKNFSKMSIKEKFLFIMKIMFNIEIGGMLYYMIEVAYRGRSHISMFLVGGLCFVFIGLINEYFKYDMYIELQVIIGTLIVLVIEFISGCILNILLKLNVWDYSNLPGNILGQICPQFALLWIPIVLFGIWLDDFLKYTYFTGYEKPYYRSWILEKIKTI